MLEFLKAIGLVILSLSILVTIHELGHFWAARLFKIRVDVFSLFFPPKLFSWKRGDMTWQIGSIPLGGYVKIAGMIDESMDKDFLDKPAQPWEFRAKPVWQRLIVMVGGIIMNIVLGITIFSCLKMIYGEKHIPISEAQRFPVYAGKGTIAERIGFRTGDIFVSVNGEQMQFLDEAVGVNQLLKNGLYYEVKREGKIVRLDVPDHLIDSVGEFKKSKIQTIEVFLLAIPAVVSRPEKKDSSNEMLPIWKSGITDGDRIVSIDDEPVNYYYDIPFLLEDKAGKPVRIGYKKPGSDSVITEELLPYINPSDSLPKLGIQNQIEPKADTLHFGFFGALKRGTGDAFGIILNQVFGYKKIFTGKVSATKSVQGPIGIFMQLVDGFDKDGWRFFWHFTAFISMALAFANMLPIPALDGGHVVFLLYEAVTGKVPSEKVRIYAQYVGMVILLGLMLFIFGNDIRKLIFGNH